MTQGFFNNGLKSLGCVGFGAQGHEEGLNPWQDVCTSYGCWIVEPFVSKLYTSVYHYQTECYAKWWEFVCEKKEGRIWWTCETFAIDISHCGAWVTCVWTQWAGTAIVTGALLPGDIAGTAGVTSTLWPGNKVSRYCHCNWCITTWEQSEQVLPL